MKIVIANIGRSSREVIRAADELPDESLEGYAAWQRGVSLNGSPHGASPYPADSDEDKMWIAGWLDAERDNGQFGVGA